MGVVVNLLDFAIGETVRITVLAKERDGTVLLSPGTATMTLNIAALPADTPIVTFNTTPEITLTDTPTSDFTIALPTAAIPLILEGITYRYDIYTASAGGDVLHQAGGALRLKPAIEL